MKKQILGAGAVLAAGLIAGSAFSLTAAANAATDATNNSVATTNSVATDSAATTQDAQGQDRPDIFSPTPVRSDETAVTGDALAKVTAAAEAKAPGATVIRVETDGDGNAKYEVHMKKADGSVTTVYVDESYNVVSQEDGFGPGPKGGHGPRGDNDGDGPAAGGFQLQAPSTSTTQG